ncbi:MAG: hypothetical protein WKG00_27840 [Polyangiaceae bacterium]
MPRRVVRRAETEVIGQQAGEEYELLAGLDAPRARFAPRCLPDEDRLLDLPRRDGVVLEDGRDPRRQLARPAILLAQARETVFRGAGCARGHSQRIVVARVDDVLRLTVPAPHAGACVAALERRAAVLACEESDGCAEGADHGLVC